MKFLFILTLVLYTVSSNRHFLIEKINNNKKSTWTAGMNEKFLGQSNEQIKHLLGARKENVHMKLPEKDIKIREDLPENFDLREAYPKCEALQEIRDQGSCGSCWAFGAAEVMSDKICMLSGQVLQTRISPLHIVSCCSSCGDGCFGGYPSAAFGFFVNHGIPTGGAFGDKTTCKPYCFEPCEHHQIPGPHPPCDIEYRDTPECVDECISEYPKTVEEDLWFGKESYSVPFNEQKIMTEIYENGSVEATFAVYEDFVYYKKGVYQHLEGSLLGYHAIKLVGWGVENDTKYWQAVNSWNDNWGDHGTFKILKGENHLGIEDSICSGTPILPELDLTK